LLLRLKKGKSGKALTRKEKKHKINRDRLLLCPVLMRRIIIRVRVHPIIASFMNQFMKIIINRLSQAEGSPSSVKYGFTRVPVLDTTAKQV